jgi:hypothetical protein
MKIELSNSPIRNAKVSHMGGPSGSVTFQLFPSDKKNYYEITLTRAQLAELREVFTREPYQCPVEKAFKRQWIRCEGSLK